ncbi:MAG: hypothetical protein IT230_00910 [Flavobacteriales bacterium]|nr:hypothetical protein [Flavobacteriales bacterium]
MHRGAYLVGVAGGSGSGKTTLVRALCKLLPPGSACIVSQDDYYRPLAEQVEDAHGRINWDLPGALDLDLMAEDLRCLAQGEPIYRKQYTYEQPGVEPEWLEIRPAKVILVEGLFLFQHAGLRELFDLKVFVEASEAAQLQRRIMRDLRERGYSREDVTYQWEHHVMPAYRAHLLPYRHECDLFVVNEARHDRALRVLHDHLARYAGVEAWAAAR